MARQSFRLKMVLAAALVVLADRLLFDGFRGAGLGIFAVAWAVAVVIGHTAVRKRPRAIAAACLAVVFAIVLIEQPGPLAWCLFWTALAVAVLTPRAGAADDAWLWLQRLVIHVVVGLFRPLIDALKLLRRCSLRKGVERWKTLLPALVLPALGGTVFLFLFASANPVIERLLDGLSLPGVDEETILRLVFAGVIFMLVWPSLRPFHARFLLPTFSGRGELSIPGVTTLSVTLSLVLFNLMFAVQNGLDIAFLATGARLPDDLTLAQYAHRGAYPLVATALLAAAFVLVFLRPGSDTASRPLIRRLVIAWVAQNLLLVAFSIVRTCDYVDAYSLTRFRIAALVWMGLVALGLVLICWRMLRDKSASWLINANVAALGGVLAIFSVVDTGAVAASWNVRHAREVDGSGAGLDVEYLRGLGASAAVSLAAFERDHPDLAITAEVRDARRDVAAQLSSSLGRSEWSWRDARRLARVRALTGDLPPPTVLSTTPAAVAPAPLTPQPKAR